MGDFYTDTLPHDEVVKNAKRVARFNAEGEALREGTVHPDSRRGDEAPIAWPRDANSLRLPVPRVTIQADAELPHWIRPGDADYHRRNVYWRAFALKAAAMQQVHDEVRQHANAYTNAREDKDLVEGLGYRIAPNENGDVGSVTDEQKVPRQSGVAVASLFTSEQTLSVNAGDRVAIEQLSSAIEAGGAPAIEAQQLTVRAADSKLSAAVKFADGMSHVLATAVTKLESVRNRLRAVEAQRASAEAQAKIDKVTSGIQEITTTIDDVKTFFAALAHVATGQAGDAIDKVGEFASRMVGHAKEAEVASLRAQQLAASVAELRFLDAEVRNELEMALGNIRAVSRTLSGHSELAREALILRRAAYAQLGETVASRVAEQGHTSSASKLGGIIASVPLADVVIAKAQQLRAAAQVPGYTDASGRGLGIASAARHPSARKFLDAANDVSAVKRYAASEEATWRRRRDELFKGANQMLAPRRSPAARATAAIDE